MRRVMLGVAFAALALVVLMLLARLGALRGEIARLQGERPEPERVVVVAPPVEPVEAVPSRVAHVDPPAPAVHPPPPVVDDTDIPMMELNALQAVERLPVLGSVPVLGRLYTMTAGKPLDAYERAGLTPLQRARVVEFERLRDAELEALRQRWDALIDGELTAEQRAKREEQRKSGITLNWEFPAQEEHEKP